jgi:chromosome segregation ATPase
MNKSYIIVPLILLGIFGFLYKEHSAEIAEKDRLEAIAEAEEEARVAAEKAEAERLSKEEAARRTAEREAAEAAKIAEREAKWKAQGDEIAQYTAEANATADEHQKNINALELKLAGLRKDRENVKQEVYDAMKGVESARIAKRNAERQVQRMAQMVTQKAETSVLVKKPILPPPPPKR